MSSGYHWILEQAAKTSGRVFTTVEDWNGLDDAESGGDISVLALLHPVHVAHFDEVWMMAAHFKELFIYQMWSELYDVTWSFENLADGWTRIMPLNERVTLHYVLQNRQVTDTYLNNRGDPAHRRAMAQAVVEHFDEPFIWSVNNKHLESGDYGCLPVNVEGVDGRNYPAYLSPKANGINAFQNIHAAAWLGTVKISGDLLDILERVWGRTDTRRMALVEYELYSALQFLARANSRRFDSTDPVRYVVGDYVQAAYIARMWNLPPERVLPLPMRPELKAQLNDVKGKGTGRKRSTTDDQRRENHRARDAKRRAERAAAEGRKPKSRKRQKSKMPSQRQAA